MNLAEGASMGMLEGKTVVLGVSGSISAYKSANLASLLMKQGARVRVVMTEAATKFISDLTFEALTHEKVPVGCAAEAVAAAREAAEKDQAAEGDQSAEDDQSAERDQGAEDDQSAEKDQADEGGRAE